MVIKNSDFEKVVEAAQDASFILDNLCELAQSEDGLIRHTASVHMEEFLPIKIKLDGLSSVLAAHLRVEIEDNVQKVMYAGNGSPRSMAMSVENVTKMGQNVGFLKSDLQELIGSEVGLISDYAIDLSSNPFFEKIKRFESSVIEYSGDTEDDDHKPVIDCDLS